MFLITMCLRICRRGPEDILSLYRPLRLDIENTICSLSVTAYRTRHDPSRMYNIDNFSRQVEIADNDTDGFVAPFSHHQSTLIARSLSQPAYLFASICGGMTPFVFDFVFLYRPSFYSDDGMIGKYAHCLGINLLGSRLYFTSLMAAANL